MNVVKNEAYLSIGVSLTVRRRFRWAIIHISSGIVASRFYTKRDVLKAWRSLPLEARDSFEVVSISDPRVKEYYEKVNAERRRCGLKPLDPFYS